MESLLALKNARPEMKNLWCSPDRMSGTVCLRGHRFPLSKILFFLAAGRTIRQIAYDYEQDEAQIRAALTELGLIFHDTPGNEIRFINEPTSTTTSDI